MLRIMEMSLQKVTATTASEQSGRGTSRPLSGNTVGAVLWVTVLLFLMTSGYSQAQSPDPARQTPKTPSVEIRKDYKRGPLSVRMIVDKNSITIAENVTLTIEADYEDGYEVVLPAFGDKLGEFGILDYGESQPQLTAEGRIRTRKTYRLEPFLSGEYKIAPMEVKLKKKDGAASGVEQENRGLALQTEEISIEVKSLLGNAQGEPAIDPIVEPVDLPGQPWSMAYLLLGAACVMLGGGAAFLWVRRRGRNDQGSILPVSAHLIAWRQLHELLAEKLPERGELKTFFARISDVVRTYIENRFGLHAPKLTTEEFLASMNRSAPFAPEHRELLDSFLRHCDLVKFAEHRPTYDEINQTIDSCKAFIEATKEDGETGRGDMEG